MGVVGLAENIATQPSLAGAWAELGNILVIGPEEIPILVWGRRKRP